MASTSRSRPWFDLPTDILLVVFENLKGNFIDLLYSARVCLSWNLVVQKLHPRPSTSPLIAYQSIGTSNRETFCLLNTQTNRTDKFLLPELCERWVRSFGHDGWLLTIRLKYPHAIQLLNLVTGVRINLPSTGKKLIELKKMRIVMSTKNPSDPNCIILASHGFLEDLAFWRPGDRNWMSIGYYAKRVEIKDAIFYNGDFYILAKFPKRQVIYLVQMKPNEKSSPILKTFVDTVPRYIDDNYLVEVMGELLIVSIVSIYSNQTIKVHKLELENDKKRWEKVKSIGKNAIYLAHFSSLSMQVVSSTNNQRENCIHSSSRNIQTESCIYFLDESGWYGYDSFVYDMLAYQSSFIKPLARLTSRSFVSPIGWYFY